MCDGGIGCHTFRIDKESEDFASIKKEFKLTKIGDNKPEMRFYPNQVVDYQKDKASFAILFNKDSKDISSILGEI